jgi:hypothetical protein
VHKSEISCEIEKRPTERKMQLMQWKTPSSPSTKKARMSRSHVKAMMIVLINIRGAIIIEWRPEG